MDDAAQYRAEAAKFRELASQARDRMTVMNLLALADEYDAEAARLERGPDAEPPLPMPE